MFQDISHPVFNTESPTRNDLLDYTTKKIFLRWTKSKDQWRCLNFLVDSYLDFIKKQDLLEYNGKFWIDDQQMVEFPKEDFEASLQMFFSDETLWKHPSADFMRHEHLRVLFFIAALRYRNIQEPQQQIKFEEANQSEGGIIDLFLFGREKKSPTYALQIRLLTRFDVDKRGKILETRRTSEFLEKGITTFNKYIEDSERTFKSCLPSLDSESGTQGLVVLVNPYGLVWRACGYYSETVISQLLGQDSNVPVHHNQNSQENMLNFGSQNSNSTNLLRQMFEICERAKREAAQFEAISSLSSVSHYSSIPSRDTDSWVGMNHQIQPMPSFSQQSYQTNWNQYNGLPQYYPNQGMPLAQPQFFQPNFGPSMVAMPYPNQFVYPTSPQAYLPQFNQGYGGMSGGGY